MRNRSILSNAEKHQDARLLLNVDLKDFFQTIAFARVRGVFIRRFQLPPDVATVLARLCCNTGDVPDHLPQGAPTSPIISNMVCHSMDREFVSLSRKRGVYYTRYADDLTFSTRRRSFPPEIAVMEDMRLVAVGSGIQRIVSENNFVLNDRKKRAAGRTERLSVTGLTVNEFPNIRREFLRSIRGMINAWQSHGLDAATATYIKHFDLNNKRSDFKKVLAGRLAFLRLVRGVDDRVFRRLYDRTRALDQDSFPELPEVLIRGSSLSDAARDWPAISRSDSMELRRQYFRRLVASAEGTLWLVDPNLRPGALEDIEIAADSLRVHSVNLLSHDDLKGADTVEYVTIMTTLEQRNVVVEWRVLKPMRQFHDRWVGDDVDWITFGGPIGAVRDPSPAYSQIQVGRRPPLIDQWWASAKPIPMRASLS